MHFPSKVKIPLFIKYLIGDTSVFRESIKKGIVSDIILKFHNSNYCHNYVAALNLFGPVALLLQHATFS